MNEDQLCAYSFDFYFNMKQFEDQMDEVEDLMHRKNMERSRDQKDKSAQNSQEP